MEKLCDRLGQEEDVEIKHLEQLVEFIQIYIGQNHHAKEEVILFPALERSGVPREGGPICVMLMEHHMGKEYLVGDSVTLADISFVTTLLYLYRFHLHKGKQKKLKNVTRVFAAHCNRDVFKGVLGRVVLCEQAL